MEKKLPDVEHMTFHLVYHDEIGMHTLAFNLRKNHLRILDKMLGDFDLRNAALISTRDNVDMDSLLGEGLDLYKKFEHLNQLINGRKDSEGSTPGDGPVAQREQRDEPGKRRTKVNRSVSIHTHAGRQNKKPRPNARQARKTRS